jgi:hypothetical protein
MPASLLTPWANFYVMIGSSAAALTGLVFIVITLTTRTERPGARDGVPTFTTPTVVHFCAALLIAAVVVAPWHTLTWPAVMVGLAGLAGTIYVARTILRGLRLGGAYEPDLEDWIWYTVLPLLAYCVLFLGGIALAVVPAPALFIVASSALLLIFIGIHNAWDLVTYLAIVVRNEPPQ